MNYQQSRHLTPTTWKKFEHLLQEVSEIKLALFSKAQEPINNKKVEGVESKVECLERLLTSPKLSVYRLFRHCHAGGLIDISDLPGEDTFALTLCTQLNKLLDFYNLQEVNAADILSKYFPNDSQHQSIISAIDEIDLSCIQKLVRNLN